MGPVPNRAARLFVLASFLVSIGMHTAVLQAVAWAKMTVDFARRDTLAVSLEKTFDGRHPCPICVSLKKTEAPASLTAAPVHSRLGFVAPTAAPRAERAALAWSVAPPALTTLERAFRPASPPPKTVLS
jgi:hypothetical protein